MAIKILRLTFQGRLEMIYFLLLMQPADYAARECQDNIILWQDVMIAKVDAVLGELEETLDGTTGASPMPNAAYLSFLFFPFRKHLDGPFLFSFHEESEQKRHFFKTITGLLSEDFCEEGHTMKRYFHVERM